MDAIKVRATALLGCPESEIRVVPPTDYGPYQDPYWHIQRFTAGNGWCTLARSRFSAATALRELREQVERRRAMA